MNKLLSTILVLIQMLFSGCSAASSRTPPTSFAAFGAEDVTVTAYSSKDCYAEVTDPDTVSALWEIIAEQEKCKTVDGDNYISVCPKLVITDKNNREWTVSYTWNTTEYGVDDMGCPTEMNVGQSFLVHGYEHTRRYAVKDRETENLFYSLINDYVANAPAPDPEPASPLVFINRHTNYAWVKQDYGSIVDCKGNVHEFDISVHSFTDEEFIAEMENLCLNFEPEKRDMFTAEALEEIQSLIPEIDRSAEYTEKSCGADMGQTGLYVLDPSDMSLILLRSSGDWERELQDDAAKRLCQIYDNAMLRARASDFFSKIADCLGAFSYVVLPRYARVSQP